MKTGVVRDKSTIRRCGIQGHSHRKHRFSHGSMERSSANIERSCWKLFLFSDNEDCFANHDDSGAQKSEGKKGAGETKFLGTNY